MIIAKISKKDKKWKLTLTDGDSIVLTENTVVKFQLKKGKDIDRRALNQILAEDEIENLFSKALRHLNTPKTTQQMKVFLRKQAARFDQIDIIIERLAKLKLLNDEQYINQFKTKKTSRKQLTFELKQKGIDPDVVKNALDDFDEDTALERLAASVVKRYINQAGGRDKMYRYLVAKGFPSPQVATLTKEYFKNKKNDLDFDDE